MNYLLDTNILTRSSEPRHAMHALATAAPGALLQARYQLFLVPQVLYEFWVVSTRPISQNGLWRKAAEADADVNQLLYQFPMLDEVPAVLSTWQQPVGAHAVIGKSAHDVQATP